MATLTHDKALVAPTGGLLWAVASAAAFGLSGSLARGMMDAGWSSAMAVVVRLLVGAAVLVPVAVVQLRGRWAVLRRNLALVVAYGLIAVAGCQLAYFNAVAHMEVGVALLIEYTAPVPVVAWMWLRHGQRPGRLTVLGAVLGAAGLVLVLDLLSGARVDAVGVLWALGAMAGAATYFVLNADGDHELPGTALAAAGLVVGSIVLLVAGLVGIVPLAASTAPVHFAAVTAPWWVVAGALGVVTAAVAYVTGIVATRRLGSRLASFVALLEVVAAILFAWLLLGELPGAVQAVGGLMVLAGIAVVKLGEGRGAGRTCPEAVPDTTPDGTPNATPGGTPDPAVAPTG
jgi:drug/metabolite transporter (DMT)-like permease